MAVPRPTTPTQIALTVVGSLVATFVVLPLVPTVLNLLFGTVGTVLDVILPGGSPDPEL